MLRGELCPHHDEYVGVVRRAHTLHEISRQAGRGIQRRAGGCRWELCIRGGGINQHCAPGGEYSRAKGWGRDGA